MDTEKQSVIGDSLTFVASNDWFTGGNRPSEVTGSWSVVIGSRNDCRHSHSILIGSDLTSDRDYQLKIGQGDNCVSIDIVPEQWQTIRDGVVAAYLR